MGIIITSKLIYFYFMMRIVICFFVVVGCCYPIYLDRVNKLTFFCYCGIIQSKSWAVGMVILSFLCGKGFFLFSVDFACWRWVEEKGNYTIVEGVSCPWANPNIFLSFFADSQVEGKYFFKSEEKFHKFYVLQEIGKHFSQE